MSVSISKIDRYGTDSYEKSRNDNPSQVVLAVARDVTGGNHNDCSGCCKSRRDIAKDPPRYGAGEDRKGLKYANNKGITLEKFGNIKSFHLWYQF